jgi:UDP-3-O-[3-hydroxymyristoyl] N-acetylglucosamine deacetylase
MEALKQGGFAKGGSLENAVVVKDGQPLNAEGLRFEDECVRHKILDAIGDLYLAGALILGKYSARNGGHSLNNQILRLLFSDPSNYRMETIQPENQNQWQPFTRSMMMGFTTSTLF